NRIRVLKKGIRYIPDSVRLYKALAELSNEEDASVLLNSAIEHYPLHVEMWFALERNDEKAMLLLDKARQRGVTLAKACDRGVTQRVWMKSALVERELGKIEEERELLLEGLKQFPSFYKLWLMLGQLEDRLAERAKKQGQYEKWHAHKQEAKSVYCSGLKRCPDCIPLWLSLAKIEKETSDFSTFRAVLTVAQEKNPKNPELMLASIRAEVVQISKGDPFQQKLSKREVDLWICRSMQECPKSGILWATIIDLGPPHCRQIMCGVALAICEEDPHVLAAAAKILWAEGSVDDGRMVLNSVVTAFPDIGDFWALFYKL
ncbi:pre-mRNA-processing factor 6-like, partial [Trifolium medium]|nr:pre-mRNA-processing factor 6-like [Trifolium medium]